MENFFVKNKNYILTYLFILVVAGFGSVFVNLGMEWFDSLIKPNEWIPNFVIPIVWTTIYIAFAIIFTLLFKNKQINKKVIILSLINGILNLLWCLIFFTLNQLYLGNIIIIINAFFGTLLLIELNKLKEWYVKLLWIYPIWLYLATSLNLAVWILN